MDEVKVERVDEVLGWPLAVVESKPRLSHRVLAERLGYADPKDLLVVADAALGSDWKLRVPSRSFRTGARGPETREFLFDRRQALEVTMMAGTPPAARVRMQVLDRVAELDHGGVRGTQRLVQLFDRARPVEPMRVVRDLPAGGDVGNNEELRPVEEPERSSARQFGLPREGVGASFVTRVSPRAARSAAWPANARRGGRSIGCSTPRSSRLSPSSSASTT